MNGVFPNNDENDWVDNELKNVEENNGGEAEESHIDKWYVSSE